MKYPNDEDGEVLQMLHDSGVNMTKELPIEFFVHSPDETSAVKIQKTLVAVGYNAEAIFDEGELEDGEEMTEKNQEFWPSWTVYVFTDMIPEHSEILRIQAHLDELSKPLGGHSDGWGVEH